MCAYVHIHVCTYACVFNVYIQGMYLYHNIYQVVTIPVMKSKAG